ncbi:PepSY domain-containing protein [Phenylobacterium sp.]|jgi:uncharacterized membrane protein YkoI|uniref:PepSY domain-containing protein n=1 Tax=Phenylobacterium sp. TaxID=1871053 RepID=UPI002E377B70|nr:PepSY domain-containing protein [Phenylobacterium sp.]HEX3365280.1 PepSY domain-containing protein [Phenylobacterium sp.]
MMRLLFIAALLLGAAPVSAMAAQERPGATPDAAAGGQLPLSRVLKELAQHHKGKQLNTTMGQAGGRPVYLVQWQLPSGQIVVFTVDAQTGQVLGQ